MWRSWCRILYNRSVYIGLRTQINKLYLSKDELFHLNVFNQSFNYLNCCRTCSNKHLEVQYQIEKSVLKESATSDFHLLSNFEDDLRESRSLCPKVSDLSNSLSKELFQRFPLNKVEINHILAVVKKNKYNYALANLEVLCLEGLNKDSLIYCPWMLTLERRLLDDNIKLIKTINGIKNFNDFVPFLSKNSRRLRMLVKLMNKDSCNMDCGNRSYYLAQTLQVEPFLVNLYVARRLFVLEMPWILFKANLKCMLDFNIQPLNILKDLWAFRYHPHVVKIRLEKAKKARKKEIKPWMVRCSEPTLNRTLQMSTDGFNILGENGTPTEYIAKRLGYTTVEAQAIMDKHPQVNTVRITKIKEVFDYLLNEAGFSHFEVANVPRILCHSLKTTKERLEELKSYGCRPTSLIVVCKSKREYKKFLKQWLENQGQMQKFSEARTIPAYTAKD